MFEVGSGDEGARAFRDGVDERRGFGWPAAIERPGDADLAHSACQGDIGEPALFVDVAISKAGRKTCGNSSPLALCKVIRLTTSSSPSPFAARRQRRMIQEFPSVVEAAGDVDELLEIFELLLHILRPALA